jgi:hypothetical protein
MKPKDLETINESMRTMIGDFIQKHEMTINSFARASGIHQSHLSLFMRGDDSSRGMHSHTIEKIGRFMRMKR